ncbi:hypothetical protein [Macrococcus armenti]|uniref:hypothetical protein n=1 Tax=Macrococcus armenti TaxID=2875764 RepID=UPI001CCC04CB|nr:hypothetical protein [Macrococcus armenti]UBH15628.1 hypothetical protein LAU44_01340 [Macrococcus armenti]UBH17989.1 hypothetical protein LAU39_01345 [Macrococcus armenti]UBH20254.1 hypothetical protein LAU40_01340 [Macrococcus armenti]
MLYLLNLSYHGQKKVNDKFDRIEIEEIAKKSVITELSKSDIEKIKKYGKNYPNEEVPTEIIEYFYKNKEGISRDISFDFLSYSFQQIGWQTQKFGVFVNSINSIKGPEGKHSFILYTQTSGNKAIGQGIKLSNIGSKVGKALMPVGFALGVYDDIEDDNTLGEALVHNAFTTGAGIGGGAVVAGGLATGPISIPLAGGVIIATSVGIIASNIADYFYSQNTLGLKTGLDKTGQFLDGLPKQILDASIKHTIKNSFFIFQKHQSLQNLVEEKKEMVNKKMNNIGQAVTRKIIRLGKDTIVRESKRAVDYIKDEINPLKLDRKDLPYAW